MAEYPMGYISKKLQTHNPMSAQKLPSWSICRYCGTQSRNGEFCRIICKHRWHAEAPALAKLNRTPETVDEVMAGMDKELKRR
jgi:hypothetical protein